MKKILVVFLSLLFLFCFTVCKKNTNPDNDQFTNQNKIFFLVNNYSVTTTKGFDYSLKQKMNDVVVNTHTVSIRLDNCNEIIGSRIEYTKDLNEDIEDIYTSQYTEVNSTTYYKDNKIATYNNDSWIWENCTLDEFVNINIDMFKFDVKTVNNLELSNSDEYAILTFSINDSQVASFLGVSGSINNIRYEIKTNTTYNQLISFSICYSQDLTSTCFNFTPYYESVNINIPE